MSRAPLPAHWPPIAASDPSEFSETVDYSAPPLQDDMTFSMLLSKATIAPAESFRPRPSQFPSLTSEFAARDGGGAELGIDGSLARGSFSGAV